MSASEPPSPSQPAPPRQVPDDSPYRRALAGDTGGPPNEGPGWERRLLEELARDSLNERRRARRWRIVMRLSGFALLLLLALFAWDWFRGDLSSVSSTHTAVIDIDGVLQAGAGGVEAESVIESLQAAFDDSKTAAVVLRINSPGGSPVQAGMIHDEVLRQRQLHPAVPVYAVIEDIGASGGYYLAVAANRIFVNKASLVGSIGVIIDGFGFTGLIDKLGVERRMITAGTNKGFLDMFSPLPPEQRAYAEEMIKEIHRQFVTVVKEGRGNRLREAPDLFSGLIWTGERSIALGLADEYGTVNSVARDIVKADVVVDFSREESLLERVSHRIGAAAGEVIARYLTAFEGTPRLR